MCWVERTVASVVSGKQSGVSGGSEAGRFGCSRPSAYRYLKTDTLSGSRGVTVAEDGAEGAISAIYWCLRVHRAVNRWTCGFRQQ